MRMGWERHHMRMGWGSPQTCCDWNTCEGVPCMSLGVFLGSYRRKTHRQHKAETLGGNAPLHDLNEMSVSKKIVSKK